MSISNKLKKYLLLGICLVFTSLGCLGQVQTKITQGEKTCYLLGDKIEMTILVTTLHQTCMDGMEQIKLYKSGIDIPKQSNWKELKKGLWQKDITIIITGNKKGFGMLTIMKKSDRQSFTYHKRFDFIK